MTAMAWSVLAFRAANPPPRPVAVEVAAAAEEEVEGEGEGEVLPPPMI